MYIKRFSASTVKEAMKSIKAELGTDALILNTKKVSSARGMAYEVVAAVERDPASAPDAPAAASAPGSNRKRPQELYAASVSSATGAASEPVSAAEPAVVSPVGSATPVATVALSGAGADNRINSRIEEELHEIKEGLEELMSRGHQPVVLASHQTRRFIRKLLERNFPTIGVLSHGEIATTVRVDTLKVVRL